ncbi:cysteine dioxygenase family protein [Advenella mimigardefordensis]|uniref:3-mercaptopropionate dioxygenase n=2 Tax=Advenella TaxID=290425 RepID=W0PE97_ADVMD|nr:cysteine dioxygenase [Advenella mimigardefordensis]ACB59225.1 non-heme Fe-dependent thiol dioxygenase [Advenella mimigardefordensis DPN7]AHG65204.1 3-mercaptopropionate dioxygenase [Advenella mimigardefordensis DPN7]
MTTTVASPRFQQFIESFTQLIEQSSNNEAQILESGRSLLGDLVANDVWLPEQFAQPHPQYYQQYLLHADPLDRYSVVSFVWGPGQKTPIHNHTVWALIGMMRGSERSELFAVPKPDEPMQLVNTDTLSPGDIDMVSPRLGDIHRVSNVFDDRVSISIHVYGGNIGRISRHVYDALTGRTKTFISGYSNEPEAPAA